MKIKGDNNTCKVLDTAWLLDTKNKPKEGRCYLNNNYFSFKSTEMGGRSP